MKEASLKPLKIVVRLFVLPFSANDAVCGEKGVTNNNFP
jgi:hypothetical protein